MAESSQSIPSPVCWPVDPQDAIAISKDRIWVDGCFDFAHHGISTIPDFWLSQLTNSAGHAGAMLQARRLGLELLVGVHSDEEIMDNKGPTVMTLKERFVPFKFDLKR